MRAAERRSGRIPAYRRLWLLAFLVSTAAARAEVVFEPGISVGIAHTDNLLLADEDPVPETVYQLIPVLSLTQSSARLSTNLNYRIDGYYYRDRGDSDAYQIFNADLETALDPDNFFFDLGAARDQTIRDPEAPIQRTNLPINGNRVDRDQYYAGPRFEYPFGSNRTFRGSYRRTRTQYDIESQDAFFVRDSDTDALNFSVDNYRKERGFTWAATYAADRTDYGVFMPWEYRQAAIEIGGWAGAGLRVFAAAGKESAWDDPFDPSLEDDFWEVGFAKHAGQRLAVELAAGERTFGSSQRGSVDLTFRRGGMRVNYIERPMTQGMDPYGLSPLPNLLPDDTEDFLLRPGTAERFISERFDWSLSFDLRRTSLSLSVFDESREERVRLDGLPLEDEAQSGGSLTASWRAGARTTFQLRVESARREFGGDREQDLRFVSVGADYRLGSRTSLTCALARTREESGDLGVARSYTADVVSLLLTRTF